jgi:hypothetical protein
MRQLEVAELLVAANNFSVVATPAEMMVEPDKHKAIQGLTPEQIAKMEKEKDSLQGDLKLIAPDNLATSYSQGGAASLDRYTSSPFRAHFAITSAIPAALKQTGRVTAQPTDR